MSKLCIIYYYGNAWVEQSYRQYSLPKSLSRYAHVVFIDGGSEKSVTTVQVDENLTVIKGLARVLQALRRRKLHWLAHRYAAWHLRWVRREFGRIIFWSCGIGDEFYRCLPYDALVYDCNDPCFSDEPETKTSYHQIEAAVLRSARHVFATADTLFDHCKEYNHNVSLLNNACDPAELDPCLAASTSKPVWWPDDEKPLACYFGGINERIDLDAVEYACTQNPDIHFVLAGPVLEFLSERVSAIARLPNVSCPGSISVNDMRYLFYHCSVTLIPIKMNAMGNAINPQKMYAYSLLGKPIVGLATQELIKRQDIVITANTHQEFSEAISSAVQRSTLKAEAVRKAFGLVNTWDVRADEAWKIIQSL